MGGVGVNQVECLHVGQVTKRWHKRGVRLPKRGERCTYVGVSIVNSLDCECLIVLLYRTAVLTARPQINTLTSTLRVNSVHGMKFSRQYIIRGRL